MHYWKAVGLALTALGAVLAGYGALEYSRLSNTMCAWAALCTDPNLALYYLIIPGILIAVCGVVLVILAPRPRRTVPP